MREELKKYSDEAYAIVEHVANEIGPRIPGSEGEKKLHDYMSDKLKELGLKPKTEKFVFAPYSSIGGLPYAGWGGIVGAAIMFVACLIAQLSVASAMAVHFIGTVYMLGLWVWVITSVFKYKTCFDWCFKHKVSHNTYAELTPEDGKYDYTIFLSAHTDTSWTLKLSAAQGKTGFVGVVARIAVGAISAGVVTVFSVVLLIISMICTFGTIGMDAIPYDHLLGAYSAYEIMSYLTWFATPILVVGSFMLTMYNEKTPEIASPGAMDNATGVAVAYEVVKYYKENPDKMPKNCRIIDFNCGAEEAGLRGAIDFVRRHRDDGMLSNAYQINVDSIADKDYFEVIHGDDWLCKHFDEGLKNMFIEAMKEAGIEKPGDISNPVGGCDSTPFQKSGVRSITFAAQNPIMSDYYHTYRDVPERFEPETVGLGLDVVLRVIDKIAQEENAKKIASTVEQEIVLDEVEEN